MGFQRSRRSAVVYKVARRLEKLAMRLLALIEEFSSNSQNLRSSEESRDRGPAKDGVGDRLTVALCTTGLELETGDGVVTPSGLINAGH